MGERVAPLRIPFSGQPTSATRSAQGSERRTHQAGSRSQARINTSRDSGRVYIKGAISVTSNNRIEVTIITHKNFMRIISYSCAVFC